MSTVAKPGIGAVLSRWSQPGATSAGAWVVISEVTKIGWSGASRNVIETFKLDNTDEYVNKLQGILNAGTITATVNYSKAQFDEMKSDYELRGNRMYQIKLPDGEALEWDGFITEYPLDVSADDVMKGEVTWEIDGMIDFLSTAS